MYLPCMQRPQNDHQRPHHNQNNHQPLIIGIEPVRVDGWFGRRSP